VTPEPETARFHALTAHFRTEGACGQHAVYGAISTIEREAGRPSPEPPACSRDVCSTRLKTAWASRPRVVPLRLVPAVVPVAEARP
jgi:hypothetical protein